MTGPYPAADEDSAGPPARTDAAARVLIGLNLDGLVPGAGIGSLVDAAVRAEALGFDFLSVSDALEPAADGLPRISSVDALAYLARRTRRVGLLGAARSHYAEPFHTAKAIATLDFVSGGRAGLVVDPSRSAAADRRFPAAAALDEGERAEQAAEFAAVVGALWDSWEDGAEIRDVTTGRYVDSGKVHHIDHAGRYFRVKGPLITPRPPQGHPPTFVRRETDGCAVLAGEPAGSAVLTPMHARSGAAVLDAVGSAGAVAVGRHLLEVTLPVEKLVEIVDELERLRASGRALPGAELAGSLTFAERLGLPWRPSRFAEAP